MATDGFSLSIKGLQELQTYAQALPTLFKTQLTEQVNVLFDQATEQIQKDVPVRTGRLKRSIKKSGASGNNILARIDITAPYAGFVEFGTFRHLPRNYVSPAYNQILSGLEKISFK